MNYTFKPDYMFTKGIVYAEFFDPATDNLVGFSKYVTDFGLNGSMNSGDVEGGPGNMLVMCIPDTARLAVTAKTADSALNNMAITIGSDLAANGVVETSTVVTATGANLTVNNAVAPLGGSNGAVAYVLTSSGSDKATVEQNSGTAYPVSSAGVITGFTAVSGNSYCVKYFVQNSSALQLGIPALFQPKVVRAHFAVNCYAKKTGSDVMASSLYKIRHYYIPYYFFTNGMQDSVGQTSTGSVDLSGNCLTYEEAVGAGLCDNSGSQSYGFIVDEFIGSDTSTYGVDGIYFIGLGSGASVVHGETITLPVKYSVGGILANISDMSKVTFASAAAATAKFNDAHSNVLSGVAAGNTTVTASVTNTLTGETYTDTIPVTVT